MLLQETVCPATDYTVPSTLACLLPLCTVQRKSWATCSVVRFVCPPCFLAWQQHERLSSQVSPCRSECIGCSSKAVTRGEGSPAHVCSSSGGLCVAGEGKPPTHHVLRTLLEMSLMHQPTDVPAECPLLGGGRVCGGDPEPSVHPGEGYFVPGGCSATVTEDQPSPQGQSLYQ